LLVEPETGEVTCLTPKHIYHWVSNHDPGDENDYRPLSAWKTIKWPPLGEALWPMTFRGGHMQKLVVEVGAQGNGTTFQLSPQTRDALLKSGYLPVSTSLFVGHDPGVDYGALMTQLIPLLPLLTGLPTDAEVAVEFVDPVDGLLLFRWPINEARVPPLPRRPAPDVW
jgi:hypothetical protein